MTVRANYSEKDGVVTQTKESDTWRLTIVVDQNKFPQMQRQTLACKTCEDVIEDMIMPVQDIYIRAMPITCCGNDIVKAVVHTHYQLV